MRFAVVAAIATVTQMTAPAGAQSIGASAERASPPSELTSPPVASIDPGGSRSSVTGVRALASIRLPTGVTLSGRLERDPAAHAAGAAIPRATRSIGEAPRRHGARLPPREEPASWMPPLGSALIPGSGQGLLRQDRALAYLAVEVYGWLRYASDVREGKRERNGYRALAAGVARAYLSDESPPGDFEYYERMEHYVESGVYDMSPDAGLQPELNPESFNGFIWLRARTTFWEDPAVPPPLSSDAYAAALQYYADRAIEPEFRWSWRNAQLEQDLFRRTIGRSNDAFRRSIQDLGVIIANHALSTVDAYVTVRIRHARAATGGVGLEATIPWSPRFPSQRSGHPPP
jgi:hypothetical protein